jgi:hypothetical protein
LWMDLISAVGKTSTILKKDGYCVSMVRIQRYRWRMTSP